MGLISGLVKYSLFKRILNAVTNRKSQPRR